MSGSFDTSRTAAAAAVVVSASFAHTMVKRVSEARALELSSGGRQRVIESLSQVKSTLLMANQSIHFYAAINPPML